MDRLGFPRTGLYVITREQDSGDTLADAVRKALHGGAAVVQHRQKSPQYREPDARRVLAICREFGIPLIINDDIELAGRIGADGVHLGRDDRSIAQARAALGSGTIIGVSCYDSLERADAAAAAGADYVAFGRFFPSRTKPLASPAHLATLREARARLKIPIVAIGGITVANGACLLQAGAGLLAVVDGVFGEDDPERAARAFQSLFGA